MGTLLVVSTDNIVNLIVTLFFYYYYSLCNARGGGGVYCPLRISDKNKMRAEEVWK